MNRWVWPGAVVVTLAAATTAATLVGAQPMPVVGVAPQASRVSVVCPAFASATAELKVAAAATGPGLRTAKVSTPNQSTDAERLAVVSAPTEPLRVSAMLPDPFGAATVVTAENGPDRGFSASACVVPRTDHWFTGVEVGADAQSEVVVVNLDGTSAAVDLTAYGAEGRISAPRGVEVAGNAAETISLGVLPRGELPLTVHVNSSDGRVAAFVRQRTWQSDEPLGADWLPAASMPATDLVVPGVPGGDGERTVVVTNPGERTASVAIGVLTESGPIGLAGAEQVEVPAGSTRAVDLAAGLDEVPGALRLVATQPVTAGLMLSSDSADARRDPAFIAAAQPVPADGIWPLAAGKKASTVLQLANPGEGEATATLTASAGSDAAEPQQVTVPPGSIVQVRLDAGATNVVRLQTTATDLRGVLVSTQRLGDVRGLAVLGLSAADPQSGAAEVIFDQRVGS